MRQLSKQKFMCSLLLFGLLLLSSFYIPSLPNGNIFVAAHGNIKQIVRKAISKRNKCYYYLFRILWLLLGRVGKTTFSYVLILTNIFVIFTRETFFCENGKIYNRRRNIKLLMSWDEQKKMRKIYFVFILSSGKCQIVFRFNMDIIVDKFVLMCDFDCSVKLMWQLSHTHTPDKLMSL